MSEKTCRETGGGGSYVRVGPHAVCRRRSFSTTIDRAASTCTLLKVECPPQLEPPGFRRLREGRPRASLSVYKSAPRAHCPPALPSKGHEAADLATVCGRLTSNEYNNPVCPYPLPPCCHFPSIDESSAGARVKLPPILTPTARVSATSHVSLSP